MNLSRKLRNEIFHQPLFNYARDIPDFWTSTNISAFTTISDPRIVYDPFENRWIATAMTDFVTTNSSILIGASLTSNPTNGWNLHQVKADTNNLYWADYPTLGFNKEWVVVQANMLWLTNVLPLRSHIYVFNKSNLYSGGFTPPTLLLHTNADAAGNEVPAITYDKNLSTMYLLQSANGNTNGSGYLRLFSITGGVGSEVLNNVTNPLYIQVSNTWAEVFTNYFPGYGYHSFAPQKGTNVLIGTVVDARLGNVIYRNGHLWAAQTIFLPTNDVARRSSIQWFQIKPTSQELVQFGRIDDPTAVEYYGFASIAVNRFNDVLIGYSSFSTNYYASGSYSFRAVFDPQNALRPSRIYAPGEDTFTDDPQRWGDYSATTVDPLNDSDFWTIQEYAVLRSDPEVSRWGTRWANVSVPVPTNDNFSAYYSVTGSQGSTNGTTIRATRESSEPNHGGSTNSPSVWYRWVAPANGNVTFQATNSGGSLLLSALAVYTGSSVGSLTLVTNAVALAPRVTFNANSNTTYQIAVAGYNGGYGDFTLKWQQPTAPLFVLHPQTTNVVVGENVTLTSAAIGMPDPAYQWRREGSNVSGAASSSYSITNVQFSHGTNYTVVASNSSGMATSAVAGLIVHGDSAARLSLWALQTNAFRLHISGVTNRSYLVQTSTNLNSATNWYPIHTNFVSFWYTNFPTTSDRRRFYRAITNN